MLPFSAGLVRAFNHDGSVVLVKDKPSTDDSDVDRAGDNDLVIRSGDKTIISSKHHSSSDTGIEVVPIVAIVFVFLWLIVKALMAPFTQRAARRGQTPLDGGQVLGEEEQAVLIKLQRTILQMERRIESLETILIDEHRTKEKYGTKI